MATPTECPKLTSESAPINIITEVTIDELRLSTRNRSIGTTVSLTCYENRKLRGVDKVTCLATGKWDYKEKPSCVKTSTSDTGLSEDELIIIGVVSAVGALLLILIITIIAAIWYRRRHRYKKSRPNSLSGSDYGGGYRPFSIYHPYGYEDRHFFYHQNRSIDRRSGSSSKPKYGSRGYKNRAFTDPTRIPGTQSTDVDLPSSSQRFASTNVKYSPSLDVDSDKMFHGFYSDRHEYKKMDNFNQQALLQGKDPFLWSQSSLTSGSSWGPYN